MRSFIWRASIKPPALELDYLAPRRRGRWPGVLLLTISLAVAASLYSRWRDVQLDAARLEAAASLGAPERRAAPVPPQRLDEDAKAAEAVVRSLAVPWATMLQAVEQAATRDVALLQLQPDPNARLLRLTAEARDRQAMFDYARRLGAARGLAAVHLVSHQVQEEHPQRPVQFSVQATLQ